MKAISVRFPKMPPYAFLRWLIRKRCFVGTIDKVYHLLNSESKTMSVRINLQNKDYLLKPGMLTKCKCEM